MVIRSMQRWFRIIVSFAPNDLETALEASQTALVEVELEPIPRVAATQIKVTKDHTAEMSEMSDAALTGRYRGVERDGTDDPNEVFHLDREEKIKVNDLVRINEAVGKKDPVDAS